MSNCEVEVNVCFYLYGRIKLCAWTWRVPLLASLCLLLPHPPSHSDCELPFSKIARHLETVHRKEIEVARAFSFKNNSKERRLHLDLIRNRGNHAHNVEVLKTGSGSLVPRQQQKKDLMGKMSCIASTAKGSSQDRHCGDTGRSANSTNKTIIQNLVKQEFSPYVQ